MYTQYTILFKPHYICVFFRRYKLLDIRYKLSGFKVQNKLDKCLPFNHPIKYQLPCPKHAITKQKM